MKFKDILVHLDNSPQCAARLSLAISIAQQHQAHLTGCYVISHPHYKPLHGKADARVEEAAELFSKALAGSGISAEWLCVDWPVTGVSMAEIINRYAFQKDLVIVGQTCHRATGEDVPPDLPERLVRSCGRPVLIVPFAGNFESVGERVMVAWKPGRESVRALNDAMPFLSASKQVDLLGVKPPDTGETVAGGYLDEISAHLSRHGIVAKTDLFVASGLPVGDLLLTQAWEHGCDLLVMGAYTHSSRGVPALGPVAEHVLRHMTMPVLMSH